jgi:dTDP-4-dehydrorhamnose 3,5-epimerase/CDP-3, 6-dideoxy-D-glycero-D-glycero-4-hexulose-5-epimerase
MIFNKTPIHGVYIIEQKISKDRRGSFVKNFQNSLFEKHGLEYNFKESYYTKSHEDVIRGMHFQIPPHDHAKFITVISGTIVDVVLDIRKSSETFGTHFEIELSRENRKSLYIPRGIAHGFGVLSDMAIAYYQVTSEHNSEHDKGIHFDSFGFSWPIVNPVISDRDGAFPTFDDFESPFK